MTYGKAKPSASLIAGLRDDIEAVANHLADIQGGNGKIAKVSITVTFGDGTSIQYETHRTPTP